MITLKGTPKHPGIAIAIAAVLDFSDGPSAIPEAIIRRAVDAVKRGLPRDEQPEVVIAADNLVYAAGIKIPGLHKAALVCESEDESVLPLNVPCVTGVCDALQVIRDEAIVIVDGDNGEVIIDPTMQMLVHYQSILEERRKAQREAIEKAHGPAVTQDGQTITVLAEIHCMSDLQTAIDEGTDSVIAHVDASLPDFEDFVSTIYGCVGDNPVIFIPRNLFAPFLEFMMAVSRPGQLILAFDSHSFEDERNKIQGLIDLIEIETSHPSPTAPEMAVLTRSEADLALASPFILSSSDNADCIVNNQTDSERCKAVYLNSLENLTSILEAGVSTVVVNPSKVQETKTAIRALKLT